MTTQQTAWPDGVIARYLTVGGATVDTTSAYAEPHEVALVCVCAGCSDSTTIYDGQWPEAPLSQRMEVALKHARKHSQEHAEQCRAMPRPEVQ